MTTATPEEARRQIVSMVRDFVRRDVVPVASQLDLFQSQFEQLLNHDHPLFLLSNTIDWKRFDAAFADCYCPDIGAPAKAIRFTIIQTAKN